MNRLIGVLLTIGLSFSTFSAWAETSFESQQDSRTLPDNSMPGPIEPGAVERDPIDNPGPLNPDPRTTIEQQYNEEAKSQAERDEELKKERESRR